MKRCLVKYHRVMNKTEARINKIEASITHTKITLLREDPPSNSLNSSPKVKTYKAVFVLLAVKMSTTNHDQVAGQQKSVTQIK